MRVGQTEIRQDRSCHFSHFRHRVFTCARSQHPRCRIEHRIVQLCSTSHMLGRDPGTPWGRLAHFLSTYILARRLDGRTSAGLFRRGHNISSHQCALPQSWRPLSNPYIRSTRSDASRCSKKTAIARPLVLYRFIRLTSAPDLVSPVLQTSSRSSVLRLVRRAVGQSSAMPRRQASCQAHVVLPRWRTYWHLYRSASRK